MSHKFTARGLFEPLPRSVTSSEGLVLSQRGENPEGSPYVLTPYLSPLLPHRDAMRKNILTNLTVCSVLRLDPHSASSRPTSLSPISLSCPIKNWALEQDVRNTLRFCVAQSTLGGGNPSSFCQVFPEQCVPTRSRISCTALPRERLSSAPWPR